MRLATSKSCVSGAAACEGPPSNVSDVMAALRGAILHLGRSGTEHESLNSDAPRTRRPRKAQRDSLVVSATSVAFLSPQEGVVRITSHLPALPSAAAAAVSAFADAEARRPQGVAAASLLIYFHRCSCPFHLRPHASGAAPVKIMQLL